MLTPASRGRTLSCNYCNILISPRNFISRFNRGNTFYHHQEMPNCRLNQSLAKPEAGAGMLFSFPDPSDPIASAFGDQVMFLSNFLHDPYKGTPTFTQMNFLSFDPIWLSGSGSTNRIVPLRMNIQPSAWGIQGLIGSMELTIKALSMANGGAVAPTPAPVVSAPVIPPIDYDFKEAIISTFIVDMPKCECGAAKIGVAPYKVGHSSWCPVAK